MQWDRSLRLSLATIWRSRLRTLLSLSGVAIGVAAVAVLTAVGAGAERALQRILEQMGRNLLLVNAARTETGALRGGSRQYRTLELADWRAILEEVPGVHRAAPIISSAAVIRVDGRTLAVTVNGSTGDLEMTRNIQLVAGRFIDGDDFAGYRRVAVIGALVVRELYFGEWPIGEVLRIDGAPFTIVGVLRSQGATPDGSTQDDQVIVPVSTAHRRLLNVDHLDRIFVQAESRSAIDGVGHLVRTLLRRRHEIAAGEDDDFEILNQDALLAAQAETGASFSRLVSALAALALALGGVGLTAVSLLSVRERNVEIGLRLAMGARRRDILLQFLAEAFLVAMLGGLTGVALGSCGVLLGERLSGWPLVLTWRSVVVPLAVSFGVAAVFGSYPALRASRQDPITTLSSV